MISWLCSAFAPGVVRRGAVVAYHSVRMEQRGETVHRTVVAVESSLQRPRAFIRAIVQLRLSGQVPLSDHERGVPSGTERLGQGGNIIGKLETVTGVAWIRVHYGAEAGSVRVQPGEQRRPRGAHNGVAWKFVKRYPALARSATRGVSISEPYGEMSLNLRSSTRITTMFGERGAARCCGDHQGADCDAYSAATPESLISAARVGYGTFRAAPTHVSSSDVDGATRRHRLSRRVCNQPVS